MSSTIQDSKLDQKQITTQVWKADAKTPDALASQVAAAATLLAQNEVVAFPTETVYGLGGNALSDEAVSKIFQAKGRPGDNPLIVHVARVEQFRELVVQVPDAVETLIQKFWPGPLTIVLPAQSSISKLATCGQTTVGIRIPQHTAALALLQACNLPIAAPSANTSGKPSPTLASHVITDLAGRISGVLDGGATGVGVESTVLDCSPLCDHKDAACVLLRPGGVTLEQLREVLGEDKVVVDRGLVEADTAPRAPGMKYTHYAPKAPVYLVDGDSAFIQSLVEQRHKEGQKVGILCTAESKDQYRAEAVIPCGTRGDLKSVAQHLFDSLRVLDKTEVQIIYAETFAESGIGHAVMNRLGKAAAHRVITQPVE